MNKPFQIVEGPVDRDEDGGEYNPWGLWLGNTEINQIFIFPEDLEQIRDLINNAIEVCNKDTRERF